jgi:hypothetical protein
VGGRGRNKGKKTKNFSSSAARLGEEEEEIVLPQNGTVSFYSLFSFLFFRFVLFSLFFFFKNA